MWCNYMGKKKLCKVPSGTFVAKLVAENRFELFLQVSETCELPLLYSAKRLIFPKMGSNHHSTLQRRLSYQLDDSGLVAGLGVEPNPPVYETGDLAVCPACDGGGCRI